MEVFKAGVSHSFRQRWWVHVARVAVLCACCLPGCKRSRLDELPPVYPVKGEIFFGGKPAVGAVIAFHPIEKKAGPLSTSRGTADAEGKFSLTTFVTNDGASDGEHIVTVYWPERPLDPNGAGHELPADKLGGRFASATQSTLRARIARRTTALSRIDLAEKAISQAGEFYIPEQGP
jgi:hypothetical protein